MKWIETTLRKGTKKHKICRDMFITDSRGVWDFVQVKNGRINNRKGLTFLEAEKMIKQHNLVRVPCGTFQNCASYRTHKSAMLVNDLIRFNKKGINK